jgi:hypothetical protein
MSALDENFLPIDALERAKMLESELVAACEGRWEKHSSYVDLRRGFLHDPMLKGLLPDFVRTCRDLGHFWPYIKGISPKWAPRRQHVRDAFSPLFNHLEDLNRAPVDGVASEVLAAFDATSVQVVWQKALDRRHTDPEGAITSARTLLETVCKRILDEGGPAYGDKDDLPKLYGSVAGKLQIAPSQHTERHLSASWVAAAA